MCPRPARRLLLQTFADGLPNVPEDHIDQLLALACSGARTSRCRPAHCRIGQRRRLAVGNETAGARVGPAACSTNPQHLSLTLVEELEEALSTIAAR